MIEPKNLQRKVLQERIYNQALTGSTELTIFKRQVCPDIVDELLSAGYVLFAHSLTPCGGQLIKDVSELNSQQDKITIDWGYKWNEN